MDYASVDAPCLRSGKPREEPMNRRKRGRTKSSSTGLPIQAMSSVKTTKAKMVKMRDIRRTENCDCCGDGQGAPNEFVNNNEWYTLTLQKHAVVLIATKDKFPLRPKSAGKTTPVHAHNYPLKYKLRSIVPLH